MQKIEFEHHAIMGAIVEYAKHIQDINEELIPMKSPSLPNPLLLTNNLYEYVYEIDLPFMKDISNEMMLVLCSKFRVIAKL